MPEGLIPHPHGLSPHTEALVLYLVHQLTCPAEQSSCVENRIL